MIPTFVFVHGSSVNAGSWAAMQREMAFRGKRTLAVDLPGRGAGFSAAYQSQDLDAFAAQPSTLADATGARMVEHVVDAVRRVRAHGPVILVGHSLGGLVITGVANEIPDLLDRVVYIAAQCPVTQAPVEYLSGPEWSTSALIAATAPIVTGNPVDLGVMRMNWRTTDPAVLTSLRQAMDADADPAGFLAELGARQPDDVFWLTDPTFDLRADKDAFNQVPHSYIRLPEDQSLPIAAQERYIKQADELTPDNPFDVHSAAGGHNTFLRQANEIAELLGELA